MDVVTLNVLTAIIIDIHFGKIFKKKVGKLKFKLY